MPECPSLSDVILMPQPPSELKEIEDLPASTILSRLQLFRLMSSQLVPNSLPPPPLTVTLNMKVRRSQDRIPIEMEKVETVLNLKWKIYEHRVMRGVPAKRIVLQSPSMRLGKDLFGSSLLASRIRPDLDEALESAVGDKVLGLEELHGADKRMGCLKMKWGSESHWWVTEVGKAIAKIIALALDLDANFFISQKCLERAHCNSAFATP
ncbi:hypothetical protein JHK87_017927 [Glycine soja]|nr:hypothetical protein JHK87_017927 [Glycine soja]